MGPPCALIAAPFISWWAASTPAAVLIVPINAPGGRSGSDEHHSRKGRSKMRKFRLKAQIWMPTALCLIISAAYFRLKMRLPEEDKSFGFTFLWVCFFMVACLQLELDKRIQILEAARDQSGQTTSSTDG